MLKASQVQEPISWKYKDTAHIARVEIGPILNPLAIVCSPVKFQVSRRLEVIQVGPWCMPSPDHRRRLSSRDRVLWGENGFGVEILRDDETMRLEMKVEA